MSRHNTSIDDILSGVLCFIVRVRWVTKMWHIFLFPNLPACLPTATALSQPIRDGQDPPAGVGRSLTETLPSGCQELAPFCTYIIAGGGTGGGVFAVSSSRSCIILLLRNVQQHVLPYYPRSPSHRSSSVPCTLNGFTATPPPLGALLLLVMIVSATKRHRSCCLYNTCVPAPCCIDWMTCISRIGIPKPWTRTYSVCIYRAQAPDSK